VQEFCEDKMTNYSNKRAVREVREFHNMESQTQFSFSQNLQLFCIGPNFLQEYHWSWWDKRCL